MKIIAKTGFNPRSSCEERRTCSEITIMQMSFNPRSSCEERLLGRSAGVSTRRFNPRSSCEERRHRAGLARRRVDVSIHAPRVRSDLLR